MRPQTLTASKSESVVIKGEVKTAAPVQLRAFAREMDELMTINHPCLTRLIGFVDATEPHLLVFEHPPQGNLRDYLREACFAALLCVSVIGRLLQSRATPRQPQLVSSQDLLSFVNQVAVGMSFLESKEIWHGDLSA